MKPRDASPRDPRGGNKKPLNKKQEGPKENDKTRPIQEDGGSHNEPTHYVHGYLAV